MGYLHCGIIEEFTINKVKEKHETGIHEVLHLSITTDMSLIQYRICPDYRAPDIEIIRNDLKKGLTAAKNPDIHFGINEYFERNYIFIEYPNGESKQYTANKL
jgi:hypothetical protein